MQTLPMRARLPTGTTSPSRSAATCGGGWGTMRWSSTSIETRLRTPAVLNENIKQACRTLAMLQTTMGSVERREIDSKRSGVLPAGSLEHPPWTVVGRPAVKLSSE